MPFPDSYIQVAERYTTGSQAGMDAGVQESGAFQAYHAFESTRGALATSRGHNYPRSHVRKLNMFTNLSNGRSYGIAVAQLAIQLNALRNRCLYPEEMPDGSIEEPRNRITEPQARRLLQRVRGILNRVRRDV